MGIEPINEIYRSCHCTDCVDPATRHHVRLQHISHRTEPAALPHLPTCIILEDIRCANVPAQAPFLNRSIMPSNMQTLFGRNRTISPTRCAEPPLVIAGLDSNQELLSATITPQSSFTDQLPSVYVTIYVYIIPYRSTL